MKFSSLRILVFLSAILFVFVLNGCYKLLPPPETPDEIGNAPEIPILITPADSSFIAGNYVELDWTCFDEDEDDLSYDLFFGTESDPPLYEEAISYSGYYIENLENSTQYFWKIVAHDDYNKVEGPVWTFFTSIIGEFMHGGIVFYTDETGEHGLVCTRENIEIGYYSNFEWGAYGDYNAYGDGIGAGSQNTINIVNAYTGTNDIAAKLCYDLVHNGYSDWYLPSKTELDYMYDNLKRNNIGDFSSANYWSSTENGFYYAYSIDFGDYGMIETDDKTDANKVRAIRQF